MIELIQGFDQIVYNLLFSMHSTFMTGSMVVITECASAVTFVLLLLAVYLIVEKKYYVKYVTINLVLVFLLAHIIKFFVNRPRPSVLQIVSETGSSFPSAHTMVSFGFYGFLIYLIYTKVKNKTIRYITIPVLSVLIFLIGISRIYLGVHYASDVIGAWLIGSIYLFVFIKFVYKKNLFKFM